MRLLRGRDRFTAEIRSELLKHSEPATVDAAIERLAARKIVNDARLVRSMIAANSGRKARPIAALRDRCAARGADQEALGLFDAASDPELDDILARYESSPKGRARVARLLAARGFDEEEIKAVVDAHFESMD